ncbi:peroxisomal NADH pyrophosphatase NUDT12 [Pyricularia oryzae 70-15]|uniref:NAD(+) diphosphatase n=1 Tax=Pyricularia oryzae (strain 70-15 / ATCC MYA-4617 / FGSC 8958) TaxID=242507 RepID=G4MTC3_PYRO7|nr:peroxisomal NADH pyrophosphatase NUDT12 [Pyricularia oryzae 70-15]EHA53869.1 peroxisomal NADH pyrophosphatase NUDT12 [Pyricularia oryzae 70-15]
MAPSPLLPQLPADDSMLTRRFGAETANYFSGNPLNRVSFLRDNRDFLQAAFAHPSARFLALDKLAPLVHTAEKSIAWITREDVAPVTGSGPFDKTEEDMINDFNSEESHPVIILLGLDDKQKMTASDQDVFQHKDYKGAPYFAVDFTENQDVVTSLASREGLSFNQDQRSLGFNPGEEDITGPRRSKTRLSPTDMAGGEKRDRKPCASRGTVSNISFPRTDPTIIVAVVSADGTKVLLGRNKRWPKYWYSTLAGFLEPGESIEEATRREVWEESGVTVGRVVLHSSQPWPFPGSLMIGAIAQALPGDGEKIFLGNDPELEDAKWFPMAEVRKALSSGVSNLGQSAPPEYVEGDLRVPPDTAIANRLMTAVVGGYNGAFPKI